MPACSLMTYFEGLGHFLRVLTCSSGPCLSSSGDLPDLQKVASLVVYALTIACHFLFDWNTCRCRPCNSCFSFGYCCRIQKDQASPYWQTKNCLCPSQFQDYPSYFSAASGHLVPPIHLISSRRYFSCIQPNRDRSYDLSFDIHRLHWDLFLKVGCD